MALDVADFSDVYVSRAGNEDDKSNPFMAEDWSAIDVEKALFHEDEEAEAEDEIEKEVKKEDENPVATPPMKRAKRLGDTR